MRRLRFVRWGAVWCLYLWRLFSATPTQNNTTTSSFYDAAATTELSGRIHLHGIQSGLE